MTNEHIEAHRDELQSYRETVVLLREAVRMLSEGGNSLEDTRPLWPVYHALHNAEFFLRKILEQERRAA